MLCTYCSTPNPETNRFCGECGQPLARQQVTVPAEFSSASAHHSHREETTISGPSFLGLTDSADDQTDYLFEGEPQRSHTGWVVFSFVALIVLAGVGWLEWNAIKTGQIELPWTKSSSAAANASTDPQNGSANPSTQESAANASEQTSQADSNGSGQMATNDSDGKSPVPTPKADTTKEAATLGTHSPDGASDAEATRAAQSRIASDAAQRREKAESDKSDDSSDDDSAAAPEKPAPKAAAVKATAAKPPDPRQDSMLVAGEKYLYGRGVPQDCNQALIYFKAAAEKENGPAMSHLGAMYASGHCVTQNKVAAYKWFSRASESEPGNQWISRSLNMLWRDMSPQERASIAR